MLYIYVTYTCAIYILSRRLDRREADPDGEAGRLPLAEDIRAGILTPPSGIGSLADATFLLEVRGDAARGGRALPGR